MTFGGFERFTLIDYPGKTACMVYTIGCNFRCPYCHNPELVDETIGHAIPEDMVLDFLGRRTGMLDGIVITGGEPTMHESLLDFMGKVKSRGFLVKLDSNGTNPAILEQAINEKLVDYIAMDIKSPLSKYSRTVSRPVDVDAIRRSIRLLIDSPVDYEFRTTVLKALISPQDFDEIGQEIRGAAKYYIQQFIPTKILNPQFRKKVTYTMDELASFRDKMKSYVQHCAIR